MGNSLTDVEVWINTYIKYMAFDQALTMCQLHRLPRQLITPDVLKSVLKQAYRNVSFTGAKFLFPINKLEAYYDLPNVECTHSGNSCDVTIGIPITHEQGRGHIYQLTPLPFRASEDAVCYFLDEPTRLAIVGETVYSIDPTLCGGETTCDLPRAPTIHHMPHCIRPMFPNMRSTPESCRPTCLTGLDARHPRVEQIDHDSVYIITAQGYPINVRCSSGFSSVIQHLPTGVLRIDNFPTECTIYNGKDELFKQNHLINSTTRQLHYSTTQVIPYWWAQVQTPTFNLFLQGEYFIQPHLVKSTAEILASLDLGTCMKELPMSQQLFLYGGPALTIVGFFSCALGFSLWLFKRRRRERREAANKQPFYKQVPKTDPTSFSSIGQIPTISAPILRTPIRTCQSTFNEPEDVPLTAVRQFQAIGSNHRDETRAIGKIQKRALRGIPRRAASLYDGLPLPDPPKPPR